MDAATVEMSKAADFHHRHGTTTLTAMTMTDGEKEITDALDRFAVFASSETYRDLIIPICLIPTRCGLFLRPRMNGTGRPRGICSAKRYRCFFTDEPRVCNPAWTKDAAQDFRARFGYDMSDRLPALFEKGTRERADWFDWWSERFARVYAGGLREWCRSNGVLSAGHYGGNDSLNSSVIHGHGSLLRQLRQYDVPGVDVIWRQVYPGKPEHPTEDLPYIGDEAYRNDWFPRFAASAAHQQGLRFSFCEALSAYGTDLAPETIRFIVNFLLVRGINILNLLVFDADGISLSSLGRPRPVFSPKTPWFSAWNRINACFSRLSYMLSIGEPDTDIALYIPQRDIRADGENSGIERLTERIGHALEARMLSFDTADDDALAEASAEDDLLVCGHVRCRTLIVPQCRFMTERAGKTLERFLTHGAMS